MGDGRGPPAPSTGDLASVVSTGGGGNDKVKKYSAAINPQYFVQLQIVRYKTNDYSIIYFTYRLTWTFIIRLDLHVWR